jgi:hypothetical protein
MLNSWAEFAAGWPNGSVIAHIHAIQSMRGMAPREPTHPTSTPAPSREVRGRAVAALRNPSGRGTMDGDAIAW